MSTTWSTALASSAPRNLAPKTAAEPDILLHGKLGEGSFLLEGSGQAEPEDVVWFHGLDAAAVEGDFTPVCPKRNPADQVEKRRLARAVRAGDAQYFATPDGERHVVDRDERAERLAEPLYLDDVIAVGQWSAHFRCRHLAGRQRC